jgi:hypothetical protein
MTDNNNFRNVGGSVYGGMVSGDVYSQQGSIGNKARSDNNNFVQQSQQKQTLSDAAEEIQQLLKQLEQNNPTLLRLKRLSTLMMKLPPVSSVVRFVHCRLAVKLRSKSF